MGTTTYDKLSRGRKQEIDLKRREDLKKAKDMPKSRASDTVVDVIDNMGGYGLMPGKANARASYKADREEKIRKAQDKADYKDLKEKPTKFFRDKNAEDMPLDEMLKSGEFKVEKYKKGGKIRGYGLARGGKVCKSK